MRLDFRPDYPSHYPFKIFAAVIGAIMSNVSTNVLQLGVFSTPLDHREREKLILLLSPLSSAKIQFIRLNCDFSLSTVEVFFFCFIHTVCTLIRV